MQSNPYDPNQCVVEKTLEYRHIGFAQRIGTFGFFAAVLAFGVGVGWIKLLRRNLSEVNPVSWTLAQSLAFGAMAIVMIAFVSLIGSRVSQFTNRLSNKNKAVFGWNCVPVILSSLIAVAWFGVACLGLISLFVELMNYDFYRGLPVLEIVLQFLLYVSAFAAVRCCLQANRQWMRNNSGRALYYTMVGFLSPVLAYAMLFQVCENLVRSLV